MNSSFHSNTKPSILLLVNPGCKKGNIHALSTYFKISGSYDSVFFFFLFSFFCFIDVVAVKVKTDRLSCNTGIVYYDLHQDGEVPDLSVGKRVTRHVFTVEEILQFLDDYHTKGVLSLPYGDIVEPFEAWYSKTKKMSRIDYYNGKNKFNLAI